MLVKTKGIVLRTLKFKESAVIVDLLTKDIGFKSFIVHGIRSRKSSKGNYYTLMNDLNIEAQIKQGQSLHKIQSQDLSTFYRQIPFDFIRANVGIFLCELISKVLRRNDTEVSFYPFVQNYLLFLDQSEKIPNLLHLHFMLHWAKMLGIGIDQSEGDWFPFIDLKEGKFVKSKPTHENYITGEHLELAKYLMITPLEQLNQSAFTKNCRNATLDCFIFYYRYHLDNLGEINSHEVLKEVF